MPKQHRLGALEVGIPGQNRLAIAFRHLYQAGLQLRDGGDTLDQGGARKQARIGSDLIVATTRGVESAGRFANAANNLRFHQAVDVFVVAIQRRRLAH